MGLIYIFPTEDSTEEIENGRVEILKDKLTLKTYGLPMIFWAYLTAIYIVVATMWLTSSSIIDKMLTYHDPTLTFLAYLVRGTLILGPFTLLCFFFYEKFLIKEKNTITLIHRLFFIKFYSKKIIFNSNEDIYVEHFLDSPNMAKMRQKAELKGFENKGYYELKVKGQHRPIFIDRHNRKSDLVKIKDLLSKY